jgi:hypothetical protein
MQQCGFKISFIFLRKKFCHKNTQNTTKKYIKESGFDNINEVKIRKA